MQDIRRLLHDQVNVITSINGFLELAQGETDRRKKYHYIERARREVRRASKLTLALRTQIEAKLVEGFCDDLEED